MKSAKQITKTAAMLALLVVLQFVTRSLGQFVTGSCVNFILSVTTFFCGPACAVAVAVLSPFFAFLFGIGPAFLPIVPAICVGNTVLVLALHFGMNYAGAKKRLPIAICTIVSASLLKFAVISLLVVKIIMPLLPLTEKQLSTLSAAFSWPQLVTALIGSALAVLLWPRLSTAIRQK